MRIGESIYNADTPVLWVDLDILERNISFIANKMKQAGVLWRPHTKGLKIPAIAHKLVKSGAIGITCAKLPEAEIMAYAGMRDILIGNEVVGELKITRLVNLRRYADVMVAVDDFDNARQISHAAASVGLNIRVLVELNIGMNRAGINPGSETVEFVQQVKELPGLTFAGLMGWEGHVVSIADPQEKQAAGEKAIRLLVQSADLVRQSGIPVEIVSCGGSGSYGISSSIPGVTEIQAGGACFGDETYVKWGAGTEPALYVLATVTSHAVSERAIVDAGRKSLNREVNMPRAKDIDGVELMWLSSEHGVLDIKDPTIKLKVGDKMNFIVGYGDWTVFLHDRLVGVRDGRIELVWEIPRRGMPG